MNKKKDTPNNQTEPPDVCFNAGLYIIPVDLI